MNMINCFVLALIYLCSDVSGFRVKLVGLTRNFDSSSASTDWEKKSFGPAILQDACSDRIPVDKSDLFNIVGIKNPWDRATTNIFSSDTVTNSIDNFLTTNGVEGIQESLQEILQYFAKERCYGFPFGGLVRDMFLGSAPKDLDMDVSCSVVTFYNKCVQRWSTSVCSINQKQTIAHVGKRSDVQEQIDAAYYEKNFFGDLSGLEYTANALGYDSNENNVVMDVAGTGVEDVCTRKIRIPVGPADWDKWIQNNPPSVVYRYWKLRGKGFEAYDQETENFIMGKAKTQIMNDEVYFYRFYCFSFIKGQYDYNYYKCYVPQIDCNVAKMNQQRYNDILIADLGQVFWNDYLAFTLEDFVSCY